MKRQLAGNRLALPPPLDAANTIYVALYLPLPDYAADTSFFANSGVTSGRLVALSNAAANGNGVFSSGNSFPTSSFNATNYWVDVDSTKPA